MSISDALKQLAETYLDELQKGQGEYGDRYSAQDESFRTALAAVDNGKVANELESAGIYLELTVAEALYMKGLVDGMALRPGKLQDVS